MTTLLDTNNDFDLFRAPENQHQAVWCFEMRDVHGPSVRLGEDLQLNVIELKKAERPGRLPPTLSRLCKYSL